MGQVRRSSVLTLQGRQSADDVRAARSGPTGRRALGAGILDGAGDRTGPRGSGRYGRRGDPPFILPQCIDPAPIVER